MQVDEPGAVDNLEVPPDVLAAIASGNKVQAVRLIREHTGLGLGPAKRLVDHLARTHGGTSPEMQPQFTEVGGSKGFAVIVVACLLAWLLYQALVAG